MQTLNLNREVHDQNVQAFFLSNFATAHIIKRALSGFDW